MSYSVFIENDHVYVKYAGLVDALDIVRLTADEKYINNLRRLQRVIHDFSFCEDVSLGSEDIREIVLISNMETNFTEKAVVVVIPFSPERAARVEAFGRAIKSPDWVVLVAKNYAEAITKIR